MLQLLHISRSCLFLAVIGSKCCLSSMQIPTNTLVLSIKMRVIAACAMLKHLGARVLDNDSQCACHPGSDKAAEQRPADPRE